MALRTRSSAWLLGALALAAGVLPAHAHHSRAAFDTSTEVTIDGVVANVLWANPHTYITLEVTDPDGRPAKQEVEVGPLSTMGPLGLTRGTLSSGERVSVRAYPSRRGPGNTVMGLAVTKNGGETYPLHVMRGQARPQTATQQAESIAGKWVPLTPGFLSLIQESRSWPLTEQGRAAVNDTEGQLRSQASCEPWPSPLLMALPMLRTIDVQPSTVTLRFDWMGSERVVHLDQAEHPANLEPTRQGHSIGRWEDGALVIDTVGFLPHREGAGFGLPSSPDKRMRERLSLNPDRTHLVYEFTVEDPLSLTVPVTRTLTWAYRPDVEPTDLPCDAEIATRFLHE